MKIQSFHAISFMSLCGALGMVSVLIIILGIVPEGLEPRIVWNGKDIAPRLAIYSKCEGKIQEWIPAVKVFKKDKGTVTTVRSYVSGLSRDLVYQAEFTSHLYDPWQRGAICWHWNRLDRSLSGESGGIWGPV